MECGLAAACYTPQRACLDPACSLAGNMPWGRAPPPSADCCRGHAAALLLLLHAGASLALGSGLLHAEALLHSGGARHGGLLRLGRAGPEQWQQQQQHRGRVQLRKEFDEAHCRLPDWFATCGTSCSPSCTCPALLPQAWITPRSAAQLVLGKHCCLLWGFLSLLVPLSLYPPPCPPSTPAPAPLPPAPP